ncbi:MAG: hypothetical protein V1768_02650 [Patescibacteria group bacterium]
MKRKGELTTQQLITIIILIVSFGVLLFFIFRLNLGGDVTNKEICHNSVLMKSKSKIGGSALDCRTNYICISGGGKCEGFSATDTVEIDVNSPNAKEQVMKAIADEMADCWWMFGEGKVDYVGFSIGTAITGDITCSLCSIISFDKKIRDDEKLKGGIEYEKFYNYLQSIEKETGRNYLYYLYGAQDIEEVKKIIPINFQESIEFNKQYSVLTGVGKLDVLRKSANWFYSGFDAFNSIFGLDKFLGKTVKFKGYGTIPVTIKEKSKVNGLGCTDFLTKA